VQKMLGLSLTSPRAGLTKPAHIRSMRSPSVNLNCNYLTGLPVSWRVAVVQIGKRHVFEVPQERT